MKNTTNNTIPETNEDTVGGVYAIQELSECIKWLAELQVYQGNKESTDFYNGDNACGSWYSAKITQVLADKIIAETEKFFNSSNSEVKQ